MGVHVRGISIGEGDLVLIAGPCIIESLEHLRVMAGALKEITGRLGMPFIFKASFDKANRSSINAYRGPGLEDGLRMLSQIKKEFDLAVTSDISSYQSRRVACAAINE